MTWTVDVERIAGILAGSATIDPGVNAVRGSNWQGKSSFIEALKAGLGTSTELTEGADSGRVELRTPDGTVTVDLVRENGSVVRQGTPYLDDEYDVIRAELFACLDERNEIRRTVRRGENLEDVLMRPLDFQDIDERIADLKREREQVDAELSQAEEASKRLPSVQRKVQNLEAEIEELQGKREKIASADEDGDDDGSAQRALSRAQTERNEAEQRVERLEASIERTEQRLEERREELAELEVPEDDVEERLVAARDRLSEHERDLEILQSLYSATELVLDENRVDLVTEVQRDLVADELTCWICGQETTRSDVESQLDALGDELTERRATTESLQSEVEDLENRREEIQQRRRRRTDLETEIVDLEDTLADREESLEAAQERLREATTRVEDLSEDIDETMEELSDVESEIKFREAELDDSQAELEQLQTRADRLDTLRAEREDLTSEIETLRNRKDRIRREAREAFDETMGEIISRFDTGFETARLTADFEIVVARDGREASLDALSEGELELIGFVAALAGRESFDVDESVPLLLVDGVGGLDDANLHTLVRYLQDRAEYLVFTVYPEYDGFDGREIDPAEWTVANDGRVSVD
ncbi:archaea-specific SMC-related protein [Halorientalis pallida]|uniref:ATPase n=1 Tax=Halorientalis pallida TaxID=2479928 RepID=A0A498KW65_9EURY|nr:archaea-specific SMC-related protein [Halorientalis pallida]RXK47959.1 ATPase [Halorientalis pallida]